MQPMGCQHPQFLLSGYCSVPFFWLNLLKLNVLFQIGLQFFFLKSRINSFYKHSLPFSIIFASFRFHLKEHRLLEVLGIKALGFFPSMASARYASSRRLASAR